MNHQQESNEKRHHLYMKAVQVFNEALLMYVAW